MHKRIAAFIIITLTLCTLCMSGCGGNPSDKPATTIASGKVSLSILFPARKGMRTIPQATESILITVTGDGILSGQPFRKGYDRPSLAGAQQVDAVLILPLGAKTILAEARDVSASDAEKFNTGNILASKQQTITLDDASFFTPVPLTLDLVVPTPVITFVPTVSWSVTDGNNNAVTSASGKTFTKTDTKNIQYYDGTLRTIAVTTTMTGTLDIPDVTDVTKPFIVKLTLTRDQSCNPLVTGMITNGSLALSIPNGQTGSVSSTVGAGNPKTISLQLEINPISGAADLYHIDQRAVPGFTGYTSGTFIPQGGIGGYGGNWDIATFSGATGITLNGNILMEGYITPDAPALTGSQFNIIYYQLECRAHYTAQ